MRSASISWAVRHATVIANGTYSYTLNNANAAVQALTTGQTLTEAFTYTLTDNDGDTSPSTLTITINGTNDVPTVTVRRHTPATTVTRRAFGAGGRAGRARRRPAPARSPTGSISFTTATARPR